MSSELVSLYSHVLEKKIARNEFIRRIRQCKLDIEWIEKELIAAYSAYDLRRISVLLDCLSADPVMTP